MRMTDFEEAVLDAMEWKAKCRKLEAESVELMAALAKAHEYGYQYRQERNSAEAELAALRRELREVQMERDILKKAVGIFSKTTENGSGS